MSQINRTGTFRGVAIDSGVGLTKNEFPQWVANLQASEYYDEETEQWIDWSEYEEKEIQCYLVLFGNEGKPLLNTKQLQKAFGWSGESFQELETYVDVPFQFRVEENTYEGTTRLRVQWVDAYDAEPGRVIQKLEPAEVKKLDAKYAAALRKFSGGPKPKSVPDRPDKPEKPVAPAPDKEAAKAALKEQVAERATRGKAAEAKAAKREKTNKPPKPPVPAPKKKYEEEHGTYEVSLPVKPCTRDKAWETCYKNKGRVSDDELANIWVGVIDKLGDEDKFNEADWAQVRDEVLAKVNVPI